MALDGKIAFIRLPEGKVDVEDISEDTRRLFLGGRGINMQLLYNLVTPETKPLSHANPLIIGAGLLSGVFAPTASRCNISGKSPETGLIGDSNMGGHFGPALRRGGFDHLVIMGRAEEPIYLLVEDWQIEIKDAHGLWGKDAIETMKALKEVHGESSQSICIGQAGENLVRFAGIRHGWKNTAGRTGMGCLMGSKKVKAIVAKGLGHITVADPDSLKNYTKELTTIMTASKAREALNENGTPFLYDLHNHLGVVRTHNGQLNKFEDGRDLRSSNLKKKYYVEKKACFACPIVCRHRYEIKEGPNAGLYGEGPEYGTLGAFGPICGIKNLEPILVINDLLNRYGLDSNSTGNIIAWAIELFEKGIIDERDTEGLVLRWGDEEAIIKLVHMIAQRKGFGDLLSQGAKVASERIGKDSERYLIWSKFLPQSDAVDVRAYKGFALGVATASRGADHLRSRPTMEALNLSAEKLKGVYGRDVSCEQTSYEGKAYMVWWSEVSYAVGDSLGICRFAQKFNSTDHLGFEEMSKLIYYATGFELSTADLIEIGERIVTLERLYLQREGVGRKYDTLPSRYFEPMPLGKYQGEKIDREAFSKMLNEFYELHGWDAKSGVPKNETIERLGLGIL